MTNLELINDSIQKMANKPSEGAIIAAQSIAKVLDDALVNKYEIEWKCLPIQGSETVVVISVGSKFGFVCRIFDENTRNEIFDVFDNIKGAVEKSNINIYVDLMGQMSQAFGH